MPGKNMKEIADFVKKALLANGYEDDGDGFVWTMLTDNCGIGFYHDDDYPLCLSAFHLEETQFAPIQKSTIRAILGREEFSESYHEAEEGELSDGRPEIWTTFKADEFDCGNEEIADLIVKLYKHFTTTIALLRQFKTGL